MPQANRQLEPAGAADMRARLDLPESIPDASADNLLCPCLYPWETSHNLLLGDGRDILGLFAKGLLAPEFHEWNLNVEFLLEHG